jgi:hypothetical protein
MLRPPVGGTLGRRYVPLATLIAGTALGGLLLGIAVLAVGSLLALLPGGRSGIGLALLALSAIALLQPRVRRWIPERACQVSDALFFATSRSRAALRLGNHVGPWGLYLPGDTRVLWPHRNRDPAAGSGHRADSLCRVRSFSRPHDFDGGCSERTWQRDGTTCGDCGGRKT